MNASDIVIYIPDDGEPTQEQLLKLRLLEAINESDAGSIIEKWLSHREIGCACKSQTTSALINLLRSREGVSH